MKYKYLIILSLILFNLDVKSQSLFTKEYHNYAIDTTLKVTVLYKDKFYCLKSNHKILVINAKTNTIDSSYKDKSSSIDLVNLQIRKDTLLGQSRFDTYFLNSNNTWVHLQKGYSRPGYFYEDEKFVVISTCSGEWGGSLYFKDKNTNKIYECS